MFPSSAPTIRDAVPDDRSELDRLERRHFPAVDTNHKGYLFEDEESALMLNASRVGPLRHFVTVAESEGALCGYAVSMPFPFGDGNSEDHSSLLSFLAVDEARRRSGLGTLLLRYHLGKLPTRENVILAHIPESAHDFYRASGWEVLPQGYGFGWIPFDRHLFADVPDPDIGFGTMAVKVLRPRAIRTHFGFKRRHALPPMLDAALELEAFIRLRGTPDRNDLDRDTRSMIGLAMQMAAAKGVTPY